MARYNLVKIKSLRHLLFSSYDYKLKRDTYPTSRVVPWLQMKGKWLEQAGFSIDTPVKIRVMNGCLVLTTEEP